MKYGWSDKSSWAEHLASNGITTPPSVHSYDPIARLITLALANYADLCPNNAGRFVFQPEFLLENTKGYGHGSMTLLDGEEVWVEECGISYRWFTSYKSIGNLTASRDFVDYFVEDWSARIGYSLKVYFEVVELFTDHERKATGEAQMLWHFEWLSELNEDKNKTILFESIPASERIASIRHDGTLLFLPTKD